jgi:hypothetical protein
VENLRAHQGKMVTGAAKPWKSLYQEDLDYRHKEYLQTPLQCPRLYKTNQLPACLLGLQSSWSAFPYRLTGKLFAEE